MGIFDAPAPALSWIDSQAAEVLPPVVRLIFWGIIGAILSMFLYRALSPQDRIARDKRDIREARRDLDKFDGDFADAFPLISRLLRLSLKQVGRVGWPAIVASLPLLVLLVWLSTVYGHQYPPSGQAPEIQTMPSQLQAQWVDRQNGSLPHVVVSNESRQIVADIRLAAPVPVIHKRQWWNTLIGNPLGYLPDNAAVDRVSISLPQKTYLPFGPGWVRGWELPFFLSLVLVSILIKVVFGIE